MKILIHTGKHFFLICCVLLLTGAVWIAAAQRIADGNSNKTPQRPSWDRVNQAARAIRTGDPGSIGTLVDAVFTDHEIDRDVVTINPSIKGRLVRAEMDYQTGKTDGLTEDQIVAATNGLARRFNAPGYAYTDTNEVKHLRLMMLTLYPDLIGRGPSATRDDSKPHFSKRMSPVEAFHITATLIRQKAFNPDFQFSSEEKVAAASKTKSNPSAVMPKPVQGQRTNEMLNVIHQGAASMSAREMLDQSEQFLDLLGIRR